MQKAEYCKMPYSGTTMKQFHAAGDGEDWFCHILNYVAGSSHYLQRNLSLAFLPDTEEGL